MLLLLLSVHPCVPITYSPHDFWVNRCPLMLRTIHTHTHCQRAGRPHRNSAPWPPFGPTDNTHQQICKHILIMRTCGQHNLFWGIFYTCSQIDKRTSYRTPMATKDSHIEIKITDLLQYNETNSTTGVPHPLIFPPERSILVIHPVRICACL